MKLFQVSAKNIKSFVKKTKEIVAYIETSAKVNPEDPAKVFECAVEAVLGDDKEDNNAECFTGIKQLMRNRK